MPGYETHKVFDDDVSGMSSGDWVRRRREKKRLEERMKQFALGPGTLPTLDRIADHEYLLCVFEEMKRSGGQAPGLDGIRYEDFSKSEIAAALREFAQSIREGNYRPQPPREVPIPKPDGTTRKLRLRNIVDRVVAGAVYRALYPYFETKFLDCSYGFRASSKASKKDEKEETYSTWRLLADLELAVNEDKLFFLVNEDVRKAFDNVDIDIVLGIFKKHINDKLLLGLVERALRGHEDTDKPGIDQGSPFSPLVLNILLDEALDRHFEKEVNSRYLRYADNLPIVCKTAEDGHKALKKLQALLGNVNMALKEKKGQPVVDLWQEVAHLLGFILRVEGGKLRFGLGDEAWEKLEKSLREAHGADNPTSVARQAALGWLQSYGPAPHKEAEAETIERVLQTAANFGFHEGLGPEELRKAWHAARSRWKATRKEALSRHEARKANAATGEDTADTAGSAHATPPGDAPSAGGPGHQVVLDGPATTADPSCHWPHPTQPSGGLIPTERADHVPSKPHHCPSRPEHQHRWPPFLAGDSAKAAPPGPRSAGSSIGRAVRPTGPRGPP
jgi:retron-type reverse transcriptase